MSIYVSYSDLCQYARLELGSYVNKFGIVVASGALELRWQEDSVNLDDISWGAAASILSFGQYLEGARDVPWRDLI